MWLFADSGSTKTEWRLVNKEGAFQNAVETEGLNPYFLTGAEISDIIRKSVLTQVREVKKVFFYGAGCGMPAKAAQMKKAIASVFTSAGSIDVAGDILAAARSSLQNNSGISCILGTGANSCVYDGNKIYEVVPSLGYVLSDWGSGTVMSKDFISLMLQQKLPKYIRDDFFDTYKLTQVQVLNKIYNKPLSNRFLASFSPFLLKYSEEPEIKSLIVQNFHDFFNYYVLRYPQFSAFNKVSIVGSIAYHYQKYLLKVAKEMSISIENLIQHPMDGLVRFHCSTVHVGQ